MRASGKKRAKLNKPKKMLVVITALMCAVACFTVFWYIRSLLPVKNFVMSSVTQYEEWEIIKASGINEGERLYGIDTDAVEQRILDTCLYLEGVEVVRRFPNTVVFKLEEKMAEWYIEVSGDYYALDGEMRVVEETGEDKKFVNGGVTQLVLPNLKQLMLGELPVFGADDTEIRKALELVSAIQTSHLKPRITLVDMESRFDINIVIDGKYYVYMGDVSNIAEKLTEVENVIKTEELQSCVAAEIDASLVPQPISVRRIYEAE
jgi:cell division septal protein FtsQ